MLYTHSWGTFFFAGSAIALIPALLASDDRRGLLRDAVFTFVGAGVLYLPWVPTLLYQVAHTAAPWDSAPKLGAPVQISRDLLGGDRITMILVFSAVVGLAPLFTRKHRRTREWTVLWTLITIPVATLGLAWISSQVTPAWASRYFAPVLGVAAVPRRLGLRPRTHPRRRGDRPLAALPAQPGSPSPRSTSPTCATSAPR